MSAGAGSSGASKAIFYVFSGTFDLFTRPAAAKHVLGQGHFVNSEVNSITTFLIVAKKGDATPRKACHRGASSCWHLCGPPKPPCAGERLAPSASPYLKSSPF